MTKHDLSLVDTQELAASEIKSKHKVRIYSRVLAAGSEEIEETVDGVKTTRKVLRYTLLLTPAPVADNDQRGGDFALHSWPSGVLGAFDKSGYTVKLLVHSFSPQPGRHRPTFDNLTTGGRGVTARATQLRKAYGGAKQSTRDAIDRLWQATFMRKKKLDGTDNQKPEAAWDALKAGLDASFKGEAFPVGKFEGQDGSTADQAINDVRSVRQGDLAVGLELLRAHEVAATVREALGEGGARRKLERSLQDAVLPKTVPPAEAKNPEPSEPVDTSPVGNESDIVRTKAAEREAANKRLGRTGETPAQLGYNAGKDRVAANGTELPVEPVLSNQFTPWDLTKKGYEELHAAIDAPLASHVDGTWVEQKKETPEQKLAAGAVESLQPTNPLDGIDPDELNHANQRFFATQSAPSLARLLCLAIDLEVDLDEQIQGAVGDYFFVATDFGRVGAINEVEAGRPLAVTLAKLDNLGDTVPLFWPASRAEIDVLSYNAGKPEDDAVSAESRVAQENGLMVLGHGWLDDRTTRDPRFEITSLDVRTAAETQEQRNKERLNLPEANKAKEGDPHYEGLRDRPIERQTMLTAGLTILDRAREHTAAMKLATRTAQNDGKAAGIVLLDAEELTVGYRPDIGVWRPAQAKTAKSPEKPAGYEWRGLMNREVLFGASGWRKEMQLVRELLVDLTGEVGSERRTMLDSASLSSPMRLMPEVPSSGEAKPGIATIIEEIVTCWDGGPMGIDCSGPDSLKQMVDDLPIGRDIGLPNQGDDHALLPPRLRFGWPYRVGLRAVFMGGASLSVAEATRGYVSASGLLAFPPGSGNGDRSERRRFLRHERIDAPNLLLPSDLACNGHRLMGFERTPDAIVRTYFVPQEGSTLDQAPPEAEQDAQDREHPKTTRRIFVAPKVSQAFAAFHGVFDGDDRPGQPEQGLLGVRYDAPKGGFPYAVPNERRGLDGIVFPLSREVQATEDGHGDAVFETATPSTATRFAPYYPDPMAQSFVLALRHPATKELIAGRPAVVSLYGPGMRHYPHALPMEVTIKAMPGKRARGQAVTHEQIIKVTDGEVQLRPNGGKGVLGRAVTLELAAGEDFELVVWCLPDIAALAKNSAQVETLAVLALARSGGVTFDKEELLKLFAPAAKTEGEEKKFPDVIAGAIASSLVPSTEAGFAGVGGLNTPGPTGLLAMASLLHHAMQRAPVDEIAANTSLRVTHAASRPQLLPEIVEKPVNDAVHRISIARLSKADGEALRTLAPNARYNRYFKDPAVEVSSSDFVLGGSVLIDLDTSSGFEIEAITTYPRSPKLDDMQKRRTRADRQAGLWPITIDLSDGQRKLSSTADIYGFQVDADGRVELPRSAVTLLRVENIADPRVGASVDHLGEHEIIDIETVYGLEFATKGFYRSSRQGEKEFQAAATVGGQEIPDYFRQAKVALPHAFPDGKARRLTLSVIALSRSASDWLTAARRDDQQIFRYGQPLPVTAQSRRSKPVDIWLPATFRPGKPITRTPLPAFRWQNDVPTPESIKAGGRQVYTTTRMSVVRVWLQREWFSSGEGEKLGVVLWPPNLFDSGSGIISNDWIVFPEHEGPISGPSDGMRHARLPDFSDLDLGPGGAYVTRWGGDPIRGGSPQKSMFMPHTAFADYRPGEADSAQLVRNVTMPIGLGDTTNGRVPLADLDSTPDEEQFKAPSETMTVSLLTYEPRFDVGSEEWYVDLQITPASATDPFVRLGLVRYQEHAPRHLQVSQPVVEWTQLLPKRTATVEVTEKEGYLEVDACVSGQAAESVAEEFLTSAESKLRYDRPVMTFSLMFEGTDRDGRQTLELIETLATDANLHEDAKLEDAAPAVRPGASVRPADGETSWTAKFPLVTAEERTRLGKGRYFVTVEEVEHRHPASYPGREPLTLAENESDKTYVASGPRFFARIDLTAVTDLKARALEKTT